MTLEIVVAALAIAGYFAGAYADERRARRATRKLRRLSGEQAVRPRMPFPSSP